MEISARRSLRTETKKELVSKLVWRPDAQNRIQSYCEKFGLDFYSQNLLDDEKWNFLKFETVYEEKLVTRKVPQGIMIHVKDKYRNYVQLLEEVDF